MVGRVGCWLRRCKLHLLDLWEDGFLWEAPRATLADTTHLLSFSVPSLLIIMVI